MLCALVDAHTVTGLSCECECLWGSEGEGERAHRGTQSDVIAFHT